MPNDTELPTEIDEVTELRFKDLQTRKALIEAQQALLNRASQDLQNDHATVLAQAKQDFGITDDCRLDGRKIIRS